MPGEDISSIAMSRDGSQGWAVGPGDNQDNSTFNTSLFHFDGAKWSRCGIEPHAPVMADPACAGLAALHAAKIKLYSIARVPLERDSNPTNDDEFQAVAVGGDPNGHGTNPVIARYQDGRWAIDEAAASGLGNKAGELLVDVAFTAPNDGWAIGRRTTGTGGLPSLVHFDGERWRMCEGFDDVACGDHAGRLPDNSVANLRLASAGTRIYLIGTRIGKATPQSPTGDPYPMILYKDPGGNWTGGEDPDFSDDNVYDSTDGGWDPGCYKPGSTCVATGQSADQGRVFSLAAAQAGDGHWEGWAVGHFGGAGKDSNGTGTDAPAVMLRLHEGAWSIWTKQDAAMDYLLKSGDSTSLGPQRQLTMREPGGGVSSYVFGGQPPLHFDSARDRWVLLADPTMSGDVLVGNYLDSGSGNVRAVVPDGQGGLWMALRRSGTCNYSSYESCRVDLFFYRYTDHPPKPVFTDAPNPTQNNLITAAAGGADGSFWLGDQNGAIYRYNRATGWDSLGQIPDWDPQRATERHSVGAIAVNADGNGIVVGEGGRIADIAAGLGQARPRKRSNLLGLFLNTALWHDVRPQQGRDRPDGSAMAAGPNLALLWRPGGGDFRQIAPPAVSATNDITGPFPAQRRSRLPGDQLGPDLPRRSDLRALELDAGEQLRRRSTQGRVQIRI